MLHENVEVVVGPMTRFHSMPSPAAGSSVVVGVGIGAVALALTVAHSLAFSDRDINRVVIPAIQFMWFG